jgi:TRAP-type C4-dicarboxylate transport system permease small subunit
MKSRFEHSVEWTIVILFSSFCLVMMGQIFGRSFLNTSIQWSEEFCRYAFIWIIFLASGIAIKKRAHMGFDLFVNKLSQKAQYSIHILNHLLVGLFLVLFFIKGLDLVQAVGKTPSPSLHIPMSIVYFILPLSAAVMFVFLCESLWHTIKYKTTETVVLDETI